MSDNEELSIEQLINKVENTRKRKFLEAFSLTGEVTSSAKAVGGARFTVWYWLQHDETFNNAYTAIKRIADQELERKYEQNIHDISLDSGTPPQSRLLGSFFMLKALNPAKYRENVAPGVQFIGNVTIQTSLPEYTDVPIPLPEPKLLKESNDRDRESN